MTARRGRLPVPPAASPSPSAVLPTPYDNYDHPLFTVGQVADMLSVQPAFLRRLDSQDLVCPARSEGAQRRYSRSDMDRVGAVCELVDDGVTLAGIRTIFTLRAEVEALRAEVEALRARK